MAEKEPLFVLEGVGYRVEGARILEDISLALEEGLIHALLGFNGAGKTTLLRILNLLIRPTEGRVFFLGQDATSGSNDLLESRRKMVLVSQDPLLFSGTVFSNVAKGLRFRGIGRAKTAKRVREAIEFVSLAGFEDRGVHTLSGGEARKVALARALVLRPRALLLDEPTISLDPESIKELEDLVRRINRDFRTTVFMVTHDLAQATRMAASFLFIHQGRIIETWRAGDEKGGLRYEQTRRYLFGGPENGPAQEGKTGS